MKKTIIYEDTYKGNIPSTVDDMMLIETIPIDYKKDCYECVYRSISTYDLQSKIAQKNNAALLEKIKPFTNGYIGSGNNLYHWGGERDYGEYFDDATLEAKSKKCMSPEELSSLLEKQSHEAAINSEIIKQNDKYFFNSFKQAKSARKVSSYYSLLHYAKVDVDDLVYGDKHKYVVKHKNKWRVFGKYLTKPYFRGAFNNETEAREAAKKLVIDFKEMALKTLKEEFNYEAV